MQLGRGGDPRARVGGGAVARRAPSACTSPGDAKRPRRTAETDVDEIVGPVAGFALQGSLVDDVQDTQRARVCPQPPHLPTQPVRSSAGCRTPGSAAAVRGAPARGSGHVSKSVGVLWRSLQSTRNPGVRV